MKRNNLVYIVKRDVIVEEIKGYETKIFYDAIEGLKAIKTKPMVVVIDLGLTRISGFDVLQMIRSNPFNHQIKIIVCTRKFDYNIIKRAFNMGADFHVMIPLDKNEIKFILQDIKKHMKYFSLEQVINYTKYENITLQNDKIEV